MNLESINQLIVYNYSLHGRIWNSLSQITDTQFVQDIPYSIGSVRNHMVHLLNVDQYWFARAMDETPPKGLKYGDYPSKRVVRAAWEMITPSITTWVAETLTEEDLHREVTYPVSRHDNAMHTSAVWEILVHIVNHGTDHRAQLLRILHEFGAPTFEQDAMIYWWHEAFNPAP